METSFRTANKEKKFHRLLVEGQRAIMRQFDEHSINRIQNARRVSILKYTYENCDFYRKQYERSGFDLNSLLEGDNFARLPLLTKHDLNARLAQIITRKCRPLDLFHCIRGFTSGTTGVPVLAFFDKSAPVQAYLNLIQFLHNNHIDVGPDSTAVLSVVEFPGLDSYYYRIPALGNSRYYRLNLSAKRWEDPQNLANFVSDLRPAIIEGRPIPLLMLADAVDCFHHNGFVQPKAVVSYGETLDDKVRERLANSFGAATYDSYGVTEVGGRVGIECRLHRGFHVFSDNFLVEIVGEDGTQIAPGQIGEIVITSLVNRVMPIIRYKTGDRGMLEPHYCQCGIKYPLLKLVEGRIVNFFLGDGGKRFNPYVLGQIVDELPLLQYQIVQDSLKRLSIRYIPKGDIADAAWTEVRQKTRELLGDDCHIGITRVEKFDVKEKTLQKFFCQVNPG